MRPRRSIDSKSFAALVAEWLIVLVALGLAVRLGAWWAYAGAVLVIATRQHALLMLYHDAVHGLLARSGWLNDLLINLLVGLPCLLPVEGYRVLHLTHHRRLGSPADPERAFLYAGQPWAYRPLAIKDLARQLVGDLLLVNGIRTIVAWARAGGAVEVRPATVALAVLWLGGVAAYWRYSPEQAATVLALWFLPLVTLTQLLQKIRSFAEHSGGPGVTAGWDEWTYTWRVGILGRLTIWPYNINLHREHHSESDVPWHELPALARGAAQALPGRGLWRLLCRRAGETG
jgi:fatty acid desaturase